MVALGKALLSSMRDLLPIVVVIAFFQLVVLQQPLPDWGPCCWDCCLWWSA
ncbi:permease of the major facilitator superfamily [Photobacterium aphoticum]|uniref:Permease of the major facilitator superfamily n=1 Tax=Photobacterium aphoticum TaxID=754436 RepID=A0A090QYZ1_9GAMM|nr:permease of the major facilitator superfamily [Photobacterium aphoticum]